MTQNNKGVGTTPAPSIKPDAKIAHTKDITKVWLYFRYTTGTTLDCALDTGILRNSITYYVRDLEVANMLQAIYIGKDKTTGHKAKHYSSNIDLWTDGKEVEKHGI